MTSKSHKDENVVLHTEVVDCPYCGGREFSAWAVERGFTTVRCRCRLLYVNPRPRMDLIHEAVSTGIHGEEAGHLNAITRRLPRRVGEYRKIFAEVFDDIWKKDEPISWLDVGAGYGEILEALVALAPAGSHLEGLEPMAPKAQRARERGLTITQDYLRPDHPKVQFISSIDVFSHIPNYSDFLRDVKSVLLPKGELFLETGNLADIDLRKDFPNELGLPDHLVFAGMSHIEGFLDRAGFDIVSVRETRTDGFVAFAKSLVKYAMGRPVVIGIPYKSSYRQLQVRARLR